MAIGTIVIGGGVDTSVFLSSQELIFRNSPIAKTVSISSNVANEVFLDSFITETVEKTSRVMVQ